MKIKKIIPFRDGTYVEGTAKYLIDRACRYDEDFSDDAINKIIEFATQMEEDATILKYLLEARAEERDNKLPLGKIKMDLMTIGSSDEFDYADDTVEIWKEDITGQVLIHLTGSDTQGSYHATNAYDYNEFLNLEPGSLEKLIGETRWYGFTYDDIAE